MMAIKNPLHHMLSTQKKEPSEEGSPYTWPSTYQDMQ